MTSERRPRRDPAVDLIRVISGWVVAVLALIAARFVLAGELVSPGMRPLWLVLVAVTVVRAVYRTIRAFRARRAAAPGG